MNKTQEKARKKLAFLQEEASSEEKDYLSALYTMVDHIKPKDLKHLNSKKSFKYGYNAKWDFVSISKDGTVGSFYKVNDLIIGIPTIPKDVISRSDKAEEQYWYYDEMPNEKIAKKIIDRFDFQVKLEGASGDVYDKLDGFIDIAEVEFSRRDLGHWFMNKGVPTYITGSHYFYLRWSKIDVGAPQYRDANRIFHYFWEACKADERAYGMCYLKNRRSGFSFMSGSEIINLSTQSHDSQYGIMSKTGEDAKGMFTKKIVPISMRLPFFFKPVRAGEERPKKVIEYAIPSTRFTKKKMLISDQEKFDLSNSGLDTTVSWRNTSNNSYDGEKLKLLILDEAGKIEKKQGSITESWRVHKTCLELGRIVVGKAMVGSTCNALAKGGQEFKDLYYQSDLSRIKRDGNGQTPSGLYALFVPMEFGVEGFIDRYGFPVFETPEEPVMGIDGKLVDIGIIDFWKNKVKGLRNYPEALNEYYRQYPRTEDDAFRDEAKNSLFNLTRIYDQIHYNNDFDNRDDVTIGSFQWENGIRDTKVIFVPNKTGRFRVGWFPSGGMQNNVRVVDGYNIPGNKEFGCFGCDSYDISGTVGGGGSKGALHGLTTFSMNSVVPNNEFFLEYIARPQTAEIFYEDVLMAIHFFGMEILIENNKPRLLYYLKDRGYRKFCMNRPDKRRAELSPTEKELGGMPNTSGAVIQFHAAAIESYIEEAIGMHVVDNKEEISHMPFNRTLEDWARFDINNRTSHDASISSGLAIMGNRRHLYAPQQDRKVKRIVMPFGTYDNRGLQSVKISKNDN